jgi:geranylgeranyl pyrophosphate synthase
MRERLAIFIGRHGTALEAGLNEWLPVSRQPQAGQLNEALRYAVFPGGKRWRPFLTLIGAGLAGGCPKKALPAACAVEFLHTSSIILDDLPAMDDAGLRRGRAALHLVFGESVALLAALALLNESYSLLARSAGAGGAATLLNEATQCVGADGMIGGQVVDLALRGEANGAEALASRKLKTTALMRLTMTAGARACGAAEDEAAALASFGECLGTAYQICDDLLDELAESESVGKTVRQDARHRCPTFVAEFGVDGAHRLAASLVEDGIAAVADKFGRRHEVELLDDAAGLILRRARRLRRATRDEPLPLDDPGPFPPRGHALDGAQLAESRAHESILPRKSLGPDPGAE